MHKAKSSEHELSKEAEAVIKEDTAPENRSSSISTLYVQLGEIKLQLNTTRLLAGSLMVVGSCAAASKLLTDSPRINTQTVFALDDMLANAPQAAHVYAVSPQVLAIEIAAPAVTPGTQQPYEPQPEDVTRMIGDSPTERQGQRTILERSGVAIGELVGRNKRILYTYDQVEESRVNLAAADTSTSYLITSPQDTDYAQPTAPTSVFRKTKPTAYANIGPADQRVWPATHTLFLTLPTPIDPGQTYDFIFPGLGLAGTSFTYLPTDSRSEAVHVSQLGFRPDDPFKVGYLSTWMGSGGGLDYTDGLSFQLIDQQTDTPVYSGRALLVRPQQQSEDPRGQDYTLTEVHQLDFSAYTQPGEYRLCVDGVGCSFDFEIASDVWDDAFFTSARGFYHQRSGIAIGAPFSDFTRPRAFHPEDGVKVYQSEVSLLGVDMGIGEAPTFEALSASQTSEIVPNAWGGYFDAGDWDRRIQHLAVPRSLLELHNLFPEHFKSVSLNLPESNNALPDILDEALWSIDFFRRLQTKDGGIRGGIESAKHPNYGEASWQESLAVMAYAPDVWSSYMYAGVAARAAHTLKGYSPQLAKPYQDSALRAMAYAESQYGGYKAANYTGELQHHVKDQRNLAALELYRLTSDARWHDVFLATTVFKDPQAEASIYGQHEQRDAAFLYSRLNSPHINKQVQANARASFLRYVDDLVALTRVTAFGWGKEHPEAPLGWGNGLGAPKSVNILQAHALTQDPKYLQAGISSTQFAAGANPDNMVMTTGMGARSPQNPLIIDQRITAQAPPPGITVYGPADFSTYSDYWTLKELAPHTFPNPWAWPTVENYFDVYLYPLGAEFTVDYMVSSAYTWGYLSARK